MSSKGKKEEKKEGETKLGLDVKKADNFSEWYRQILLKADMIDYYDVSGCYIFRPWSFKVWEIIQEYMNSEFAQLDVQNCYFPLFVTKKVLEKEKDHVSGFAAEVAWVTKSGDKNLEEPIAIRPTSETVMYPYFSKWIRTHRDLPLKLNQWCNVVRWEFKNPVPFLRGREFLWQEGHTAFATFEEAAKEVLDILEIYRKTYEDLCAVPVTKGRKTELEKFAGGLYTTTVEAFVEGTGRSVQAATSHCLGQNFSKMFDIDFEITTTDADGKAVAKKQKVWQNSWGLSTRSLGVIVLVHSDDHGLVLPPRVAPIQVVILPLFFKGQDPNVVIGAAKEVEGMLKKYGKFRVRVDDREHYTSGWKFNDWELRGVPLRIEIGPKDLEKKQIVYSRRDDIGKKVTLPLQLLQEVNGNNDAEKLQFVASIGKILDDIHKNMFEKAKKARDEHRVVVRTWEDFMAALGKKNVCLVPFCNTSKCEDDVGERSKKEYEQEGQGKQNTEFSGAAKSLCLPLDKELQPSCEEEKCFGCGQPAKIWALFGRSY